MKKGRKEMSPSTFLIHCSLLFGLFILTLTSVALRRWNDHLHLVMPFLSCLLYYLDPLDSDNRVQNFETKY